MAIRNSLLGGTDFTDGEVLYDYDLDDTNNAMINTYKELFDAKYGDSVLSGCLVTEQGTPDQTVAVASGKILINGLYYSISADAVVNLSAADATNPRYDLISVGSAGTFTVTAGTAAATPVMPTLPTNETPVAYVYRAANDNVIGTADITDCRRLVDIVFQTINSNIVTSNLSLATRKTLIVPAFRCQKYIEIFFDISGSYDGGNPSGSDVYSTALPVGRSLVNGTVVQTINCITNNSYGGTGNYVLTSSAGTGLIRIHNDGTYDFTKPLTITLQISGNNNLGGGGKNLNAVNNVFRVIGE